MKKSGLNFLTRKNHSLFDTNIPKKDIENVEFLYDAVVIPDSGGTASVRARPTVKLFSTFGEGAGFAVPTPTVPVLPSFSTPQSSHTGNTESLLNGGAISDDLEHEQIMIPPPPSTAPPPPPPQFIPPSPPSGSTGEPCSFEDLSTLQPPSMPPPKPPSLGTQDDVDLSMIKPPPMAPPKPPSYQISTNSPEDIPACPTFTPPLPPTEKPQHPTSTVQKMPPVKPTRYSSIFEWPSSTPASVPSERPASSFISQNTGKLHTVPYTNIFTGQSDTEKITQPSLENTSKNPTAVRVNGKAPISGKETDVPKNLMPPIKPVRRNSSGMKLEENLEDLNMQVTLPNQPETPIRVLNSMAAPVDTSPDVPNKTLTPIKGSPRTEKPTVLSAQDIINLTAVDSSRKHNSLLNHKVPSLKTNEPSSVKETTTSPFTLLKAAKERDKQKTTLSRENSTKSTSSDSTDGSIHPNDTRPNSFTVTPRPPTSLKIIYSRTEPSVPSNSTQITNPTRITTPTSPPRQYNGFETISFIPPPPEFANSDPEDEAPPNVLPPDPPGKRTDGIPSLNPAPIISVPTNTPDTKLCSATILVNAIPNTQFKPQAPPTPVPKTQPQAPPTPVPKIQPQAPPPSIPKIHPQAPPPSIPKIHPEAPPPSIPKIQPQGPPPSVPKLHLQTPPPPQVKTLAQAPPPFLPKTPPPAPPSAAVSQTTLLSILQKKMLEMDPKFAPAHEADAGNDEWNSALFDEDVGGVSYIYSSPKPQCSASSAQSTSLDMKELENKLTKKAQVKTPASSASSKQQFGMTFIVRPGTKQPITPIPKSE